MTVSRGDIVLVDYLWQIRVPIREWYPLRPQLMISVGLLTPT